MTALLWTLAAVAAIWLVILAGGLLVMAWCGRGGKRYDETVREHYSQPSAVRLVPPGPIDSQRRWPDMWDAS